MSTFRRSTVPVELSALGTRRWSVLGFLSLLQLLIAVDVTVVNIALPSIGAELARLSSLTWVVTGYTVVGGGLLLLGGRLGDLLGRRRLFLLGTGLFGLASLAAGLAPNLPTLVAARFAQGAGEALASPAAMSLIALLFPGTRERAKALSAWGAISSSGLVVGVLLSGVMTDLVGWRAIFLINPPLVAAVLVATPMLLPADRAPGRHRIDVPGAVLLTLAPLALVFAVVRAADQGWSDPGIVGAFLVAAIAAALLVVVERRSPDPLVPRGFFAHRVRLVANVATALLSAALSTTFFLSTLYLQAVLGLDPLAAGLAFLPFCAALLLAVTQVARLIHAIGLAPTALIGLAVTALGVAWLSRLPVEGKLWIDLIPGMALVAAGMAVGLVALQNAALQEVTDDDAGGAAGMQRCVDQLGGAVGLAVLVGLAAGTEVGASLEEQVDGFQTAFHFALLGLVLAAGAIAVVGRPRAGT